MRAVIIAWALVIPFFSYKFTVTQKNDIPSRIIDACCDIIFDPLFWTNNNFILWIFEILGEQHCNVFRLLRYTWLSMIHLSLVLFALLLPSTLLAWGGQGHQVVALIAEARLTPEANKGIDDLLGKDAEISDAEIASWADEHRREDSSTGPFHYVNIPIDQPGFDRKRDSPKNNCIIDKITDFSNVLADTSQLKEKRVEALKFVVHLVGDITQPLHCADRNKDKGGNSFKVMFLNETKPNNLHSVWDTGMLNTYAARAKIAVYSEALNKQIKPSDAKAWADGTAIDWANQGHDIARDIVYGKLPKGELPKLDKTYVDAMRPTVEIQLQRGGVRLAAVLNRAFKK